MDVYLRPENSSYVSGCCQLF